jgi:hypothetical protein
MFGNEKMLRTHNILGNPEENHCVEFNFVVSVSLRRY